MDRMPVFVKIDEYDNVLELVKAIHKRIDEAKETLARIHDL